MSGTNAGFYELASASELCAYYERVMRRHFLPTGRVRYFPGTDHANGRCVSRPSGASFQVRVRRKLVDTTYLEGTIPATSPPPFDIAPGVRSVPAGDLARLEETPECYVIQATSVADLFARLEHRGLVLRVDPGATPTMFRGAILGEAELELLRQIEDVVRLGRVLRITRDEIILEEGRVPTTAQTLHVHCASRGLASRPLRPIFEPDRVTVQPISFGFACYQFATLGVVEATVASDDEKNRLCPPIPYWDRNEDFVSAHLASLVGDRARMQHAPLAAWMKTTRLNPASGLSAHVTDARVIEARAHIKRFVGAAASNLQQLVAQ